MFGDGALAFGEFVTREPLPLATIHDAILEFLRGRDDAVVFGAQAVNAYVDEPRMTQDVDILSTRAPGLAEELRERLAALFHIDVRVREASGIAVARGLLPGSPRKRVLTNELALVCDMGVTPSLASTPGHRSQAVSARRCS